MRKAARSAPRGRHLPPTVERERAEAIALGALAFLAADGHRLGRFLAWTGMPPADLKARAAEPAFLGGVLDYLLAHEALLLAFASEAGLAPEEPRAARARLPGAPPPG
ncbi:MAG: DUF3572 family protein [Proteobacteria bacterium]|nr:DUF3572 family protein [Pseudomonadota bacterium]